MSALLIWKPAVASSTSPKDALAAIPKCFWMSPWEPFGSQDALYRFKAPLAPWHNRLVSCCKATFIPRFTFPRSIGYMDFGHILDTLDKFWTHIGHKDFGHICLLPARSSSIICICLVTYLLHGHALQSRVMMYAISNSSVWQTFSQAPFISTAGNVKDGEWYTTTVLKCLYQVSTLACFHHFFSLAFWV